MSSHFSITVEAIMASPQPRRRRRPPVLLRPCQECSQPGLLRREPVTGRRDFRACSRGSYALLFREGRASAAGSGWRRGSGRGGSTSDGTTSGGTMAGGCALGGGLGPLFLGGLVGLLTTRRPRRTAGGMSVGMPRQLHFRRVDPC